MVGRGVYQHASGSELTGAESMKIEGTVGVAKVVDGWSVCIDMGSGGRMVHEHVSSNRKAVEILAGRVRTSGEIDLSKWSKAERTSSEALKDRGMAIAAAARPNALELARTVAREVARENGGECHMDMVRNAMPDDVYLGPAAGSVFKCQGWVFTGRRVRSDREENHARELKVWRLVD